MVKVVILASVLAPILVLHPIAVASAATGQATEAPAKGQPAVALELRFAGFAKQSGAILASIFDSEAAWSGGEPVRSVRIPVEGAEAALLIEGLAPGSYAIRAFHDLDGDGTMAVNPFGIPLEPFAFSRNAPARGGPAPWAEARFEVGPDGGVHSITIP